VKEYQHSPAVDQLATLSPRELEVIDMAARGLTNREIGAELSVSVHAVKFHLASIYRKFKVGNRTEAAFAFLSSKSTSGSSERGIDAS
jgi:DNA-binding CsgD family transcriptional regulator